ncbi:hypothetical protein L1276_001520 [Flavobacterium sp. HSC-32F16]|nr:hypothetical protein [Flavobacterium sp. HSC-32F16]
MNKYIEDYDVPPYLFQIINIVFALLLVYFIPIVQTLYKEIIHKIFCVKLIQKVFLAMVLLILLAPYLIEEQTF